MVLRSGLHDGAATSALSDLVAYTYTMPPTTITDYVHYCDSYALSSANVPEISSGNPDISPMPSLNRS